MGDPVMVDATYFVSEEAEGLHEVLALLCDLGLLLVESAYVQAMNQKE